MDDPTIIRWILPPLGGALILAVLIDVFLTVLFARAGSGIISDRVACYLWYLFRAASRPLRQSRATFVSLCGPVVLVALVIVWMSGLVIGSAMVIQPAIGKHIRTNGTHTSTSFVTALYIAGDSMTTVGTSDYAPHTTVYKLFYLFDSFVGITVLTLTVTYLLEIYNALHRRNALASKVHLLTAETGDAAVLIAGLAPEGRFDASFAQLSELAGELVSARESHHFYPALFYFKFREPHYALTRVALVVLDTVTLIKSALDDRQFSWIKKSSSMELLWRSSMHLFTVLAISFLPSGLPSFEDVPDVAARASWQRRYRSALRKLRESGIATTDDEETGFENYVALRMRWDRYVEAFAIHLADDIELIDRAAHDPDLQDEPAEFPQRLRSVG